MSLTNRLFSALKVSTITSIVGTSGCYVPPPCVELLEVQPHHATRVTVVYRGTDGGVHKSSIHHSAPYRCGKTSINPRDYLDGKRPYGPIKQAQ